MKTPPAFVLGAALLGLVTACVSAPIPVTKMANSKAAVRTADEMGAHATPEAALYLSYAEDNLAKAERLISDDENSAAGLRLDKAQADAELALALAKQRTAEQRAAAALARVQDLKARGADQTDGEPREEVQ